MKHIEIKSTEEQRQNLKTLADYLSSGNTVMKFDMDVYNNNTNKPSEWECGTIACAAGHGPAAGIEPLKDERWIEYINRAFVSYCSMHYDWVFSYEWSWIDNTPEGAAKRIYYSLENGIPENYRDQMSGENYIFSDKNEAEIMKNYEEENTDFESGDNYWVTVKFGNISTPSESKIFYIIEDEEESEDLTDFVNNSRVVDIPDVFIKMRGDKVVDTLNKAEFMAKFLN